MGTLYGSWQRALQRDEHVDDDNDYRSWGTSHETLWIGQAPGGRQRGLTLAQWISNECITGAGKPYDSDAVFETRPACPRRAVALIVGGSQRRSGSTAAGAPTPKIRHGRSNLGVNFIIHVLRRA